MRKASVAATPSIAEDGEVGRMSVSCPDSDLEVSRADGLTDRREFEDGDERGREKGSRKRGGKEEKEMTEDGMSRPGVAVMVLLQGISSRLEERRAGMP